MAATRSIVVFEKRPRWVPELRRQFADEAVRVVSCGTLASVIESCRGRSSECVLILHGEVSPGEILRLLGQIEADQVSGIIVLGDARMEVLEPSLRELGATSFHLEPVEPQRLMRELRQVLFR